MRTITDREKRTLRIAIVGLTIYLALFIGIQGWKRLAASQVTYQRQVLEAQKLRQELLLYADKVQQLERFQKSFNLDPMTLSRTSLVAQASAAIQKAAAGGGIALGPIRESAGRPAAKELASMQMEGAGPPQAVLTWLHGLESLGVPLVVENVQMSVEASKPGMVKLNLTIVILDYEQWKNEEAHHA